MDEIKYKEYYNVVYRLIGAAFDVHNELHYGLSEAIYEEALCIELNVRGIKTENQVHVPVYYKGNLLDKRYRLDLVIEDNIIVELKSVEELTKEHRLQLFNYLRLTKKEIGVLLNFGQSVEVEKYMYDIVENKIYFFTRDMKKQEIVG